MLDIGLARSHVKYLTLGKSPSDDNASSLPVFSRDGSAYFAILMLFRS